MRPDMSPRAVSVRLERTEQLRRLCLSLRRRGARRESSDRAPQAPGAVAQPGREGTPSDRSGRRG